MKIKDTVLVIIGCDKYYAASKNTLKFVLQHLQFDDVFFFSNNHEMSKEKYIIKNFIQMSNETFYGSIDYSTVNNIKTSPCENKYQYSFFMVYQLYDILKHYGVTDDKKVMIIQYDGFPFNFKKWDDKFLQYDYIGAPWHNLKLVGNGGFSIRTMKLLKIVKTIHSIYTTIPIEEFNNNVIAKFAIRRYDLTMIKEFNLDITAEDNIICILAKNFLIENGVRYAPIDIAQQFSNEDTKCYIKSFGFHGLNDNTIHLPRIAKNVLDENLKLLRS